MPDRDSLEICIRTIFGSEFLAVIKDYMDDIEKQYKLFTKDTLSKMKEMSHSEEQHNIFHEDILPVLQKDLNLQGEDVRMLKIHVEKNIDFYESFNEVNVGF